MVSLICNNISQNYIFVCIFDQIDTALSIKHLTDPKLLNGIVCTLIASLCLVHKFTYCS